MDERTHINEFNWINARRRIGSKVADVVRSRSARVEAHTLNAPQNFWGVLWLDEPNLEIRAGGNLHISTREILCDSGDFAELVAAEESTGNPKPRHEGILHGREEEQPVPLEAKGLFLVWRLVADRILEDLAVGIERM